MTLQITVHKNNRLFISTGNSAFTFCVHHDPHAIAWGLANLLRPLFPEKTIIVRYEVPHPGKSGDGS